VTGLLLAELECCFLTDSVCRERLKDFRLGSAYCCGGEGYLIASPPVVFPFGCESACDWYWSCVSDIDWFWSRVVLREVVAAGVDALGPTGMRLA
jgi:hypothetical protein